MIDGHFTPDWLAKQLVELLPAKAVGTIADFAAGRGALLEAAEARFGDDRKYVATDHDSSAVHSLRRNRPDWSVGKLDVFAPRSRSASKQWKLLNDEIDGVVANPPFSFRGGRRVPADERCNLVATPAMAFMNLLATKLQPGGVIAAILPLNALHGEGDTAVREQLSLAGSFEVIDEYRRDVFPSVFASTCLVRFEKGAAIRSLPVVGPALAPVERAEARPVSIVRGTAQVFRFREGTGASGRLLHTSHLVAGSASATGPVGNWKRHAVGPFVTLPRVGVPNPGKVAIVGRGQSYIPSDCVFALETSTDRDARTLQADLIDNWGLVSAIYSGSCANYTTIKRVVGLLKHLGYDPS